MGGLQLLRYSHARWAPMITYAPHSTLNTNLNKKSPSRLRWPFVMLFQHTRLTIKSHILMLVDSWWLACMFVWEFKQIIHNGINTIFTIIIDELSTLFKNWCHRIYVSPFKTVNTHLPHDISLLFHPKVISNNQKKNMWCLSTLFMKRYSFVKNPNHQKS